MGYALAFMTTDQPRAQGRGGTGGAEGGVSLRLAVHERALRVQRGGGEQQPGDTGAALDRIESERAGRDHLVGDTFTVADLTAAALLYPLVWPPEFPYELPEPPPWEFFEPCATTPRSAGSRDLAAAPRAPPPPEPPTSPRSPALP